MIKNFTKKFVDKRTHLKRMNIPFNDDILKIEYDAQVYAPTSHTSLLGIHNIFVESGDSLAADIGTGTGIFAIALAKKRVPKIIAIDIDAHSLDVARHNTGLNDVSQKIDFEQGNMFDPLTKYVKQGKYFDIICSNPPVLPVPEKHMGNYPIYLNGGPDGTKYLVMTLEKSILFLNKLRGRLYINFGSTTNPRKLFSLLDKYYRWKEVARITIPFTEQFLLLWDYLRELRNQGKAEFWEEHGVPFRWYCVVEARLK